jgi:hypothetical protein
MALPLGAGYITAIFIAARLAAPPPPGGDKSASLSAFATLSSTPTISVSSAQTAKATVTTNVTRTATSTQSAFATTSSVINYNVSGSILAKASVSSVLTYISSSTLSAFATSAASGIVTGGPIPPSSVSITASASFTSNAIYADLCECPPWRIPPTLSSSWLTNQVQCSDSQADLPFTLPVFRLYDLAEVISSSEYHRGNSINCITSNGQPADLPYTLPIFRMYAISKLIGSRGYYRDDSTTCTMTRDGTLSKQFTRKGCL